MRRLVLSAGVLFLALLVFGAVYGASAFVYNRFIVTYESRLEAWPSGDAFTEPLTWKTDFPKRARILAIQGGSLFGTADLEILKVIEEKSGKRIYELFDFIAGSSTGAIISTLLLRPDDKTGEPLTAEETLDVYLEFANDVIQAPWHHTVLTGNGLFGPKLLNRGRIIVAEDLFKDSRFNDLLRPAMFPSFSQKTSGLKVFRNWDETESNVYLRALITAITSVPTVFPAIVLSGGSADDDFISDPALILNSPGEMAYLHARTHLQDVEEFVIVSLGTRTRFSVSDQIGTQGGILQWLYPLLEMVYRGESSVSSAALGRHRDFESQIDVTDLVLAPELPLGSYGFDKSPENIRRIRETGREFAASNDALLERLVQVLTDPDVSVDSLTQGQ